MLFNIKYFIQTEIFPLIGRKIFSEMMFGLCQESVGNASTPQLQHLYLLQPLTIKLKEPPQYFCRFRYYERKYQVFKTMYEDQLKYRTIMSS